MLRQGLPTKAIGNYHRSIGKVIFAALQIPKTMNLIHFLEQNMLPCLVKSFVGIPCPGCGMQRSFIALLKGDIAESWALYPPIFPLTAMFIFLGIHLAFNIKNGHKVLLGLSIFNLAFILINYIKLFV